jgi:hypothetical protein
MGGEMLCGGCAAKLGQTALQRVHISWAGRAVNAVADLLAEGAEPRHVLALVSVPTFASGGLA